MTKLKLSPLAAVATLSLTNLGSSFATDAKKTHICTRKLRLVLRVLLLVSAAGSAGILGSTQTLAQNAYITNNDEADVSVIDTKTDAIIATIPIGGNPYGVAVSPDDRKAYTTNGGGITVIDAITNTVITTIPISDGTGGGGIAVTPDSSKVYSASFDGV